MLALVTIPSFVFFQIELQLKFEQTRKKKGVIYPPADVAASKEFAPVTIPPRQYTASRRSLSSSAPETASPLKNRIKNDGSSLDDQNLSASVTSLQPKPPAGPQPSRSTKKPEKAKPIPPVAAAPVKAPKKESVKSPRSDSKKKAKVEPQNEKEETDVPPAKESEVPEENSKVSFNVVETVAIETAPMIPEKPPTPFQAPEDHDLEGGEDEDEEENEGEKYLDESFEQDKEINSPKKPIKDAEPFSFEDDYVDDHYDEDEFIGEMINTLAASAGEHNLKVVSMSVVTGNMNHF